MDKKTYWELVYANVIAIRLHPKNDTGDRNKDIANAGDYAFQAAELATYTQERYKCPSESPQE